MSENQGIFPQVENIKKSIDMIVCEGKKTIYYNQNCFSSIQMTEFEGITKILRVLKICNPATKKKLFVYTGMTKPKVRTIVEKLMPIFINCKNVNTTKGISHIMTLNENGILLLDEIDKKYSKDFCKIEEKEEYTFIKDDEDVRRDTK